MHDQVRWIGKAAVAYRPEDPHGVQHLAMAPDFVLHAFGYAQREPRGTELCQLRMDSLLKTSCNLNIDKLYHFLIACMLYTYQHLKPFIHQNSKTSEVWSALQPPLVHGQAQLPCLNW